MFYQLQIISPNLMIVSKVGANFPIFLSQCSFSDVNPFFWWDKSQFLLGFYPFFEGFNKQDLGVHLMVILDSELPIYQRVKFQLWKKRDKNETSKMCRQRVRYRIFLQGSLLVIRDFFTSAIIPWTCGICRIGQKPVNNARKLGNQMNSKKQWFQPTIFYEWY